MRKIKACLNSRPLYALSNDSSNFFAITLRHFFGEPPVIIPVFAEYEDGLPKGYVHIFD